MSQVTIEKHVQVALVRLTAGVTNPVNPELLAELNAALDQVTADGCKGMVLAGGPKFFSIGLDLPALLKLSRAEMAAFWHTFDDVVAKLYGLPLPTLCAYQGHATAAGSILAAACDFRYAAAAKPLFGFNEIVIGLSVPFLPHLMLEQIIGSQKAVELMFNGRFIKPEEALSLGVIDAVFTGEELEAKALEKIGVMAQYPPLGFRATKYTKTKFVLDKFYANRDQAAQSFLNCWFDENVQNILTEAAKKF